jgi:chromosome segregation ATPase
LATSETFFTETDEELLEMLESRKRELQQAQNNISANESVCQQLKAEITQFEKSITEMAAKRGQYQAEQQVEIETFLIDLKINTTTLGTHG